jgi:hypothetical protein
MVTAMARIQLDPDEPRFTLNQLLEAVPDLNAELLKGWIRRGHVCANIEKPGRGSVRRYSFHEAVQIGAMRYLTYDLVPARAAGRIAQIIADRAKDRIKNNEDLEDENEWHILFYNILNEKEPMETHHEKLTGLCIADQSTPVNFSIFVEDVFIWRLLNKLVISEGCGGSQR